MKSFFTESPLISRLSYWVFLPALLLCLPIILWLFLSLPKQNGDLYVNDIEKSIMLHRSTEGIPKIEASSENDAYFALGFCHSQDRIWQMEMNKRKALGRLSEIFGVQALESDKLFRTLTLKNNAKKIWNKLSSRDKDILIHYSNGVNAGIRQADYPAIEYVLNHIKPEPWSPIDSILVMQLMTWNLSTNIGSEMRRLLLMQYVGINKTNQLMPPIEAPVEIDEQRRIVSSNMNNYLWNTELAIKRFIGSNAWVVSGEHTESGFPVLANDPHLATSTPSIWYLAHIKGGDLDVSGATMPGLPFVVLGRNKHIGWGMTTLMADTQDIVFEKLNPRNRNQYESAGEYREMIVAKENIHIKNEVFKPELPAYKLDVRRTVNGPVISDLGSFINGFTYSLRWTGDDEDGGTIHSFIKLNYAKNWNEFNEALKHYVAPVHNFLYVDDQGNIGSLAPGKIPVRKFGKGDIPIEGWVHENNWISWIPYSDLPRNYNPAKGYIISANNRVVNSDYQYHISSDWAAEDRANRINLELTRLINRVNHKVKTSEMSELQADVRSAYLDLSQILSKMPPKNTAQKEVLELLKEWDGKMGVDTIGGTIIQAWLFHLNKLLVEDDLEGVSGLDDLALSINHPFISGILSGVGNDWCDYKKTTVIESCEDIKYISLDHAISDLSLRLGGNPKNWQWGKIHKAHYSHFPYSKAKYSPHWPQLKDSPLSYFFHRYIESAGDDTTVNVAPISYRKDNRYVQFWGASYRQIIDMKDDHNLSFQQVVGQSGNIISKNYDDVFSSNKNYKLIDGYGKNIKSTLKLLPESNGE